MNNILLLFLFLFISCNPNNQNSNYQIIYKNDKEGNTLLGSKSELINVIRGGGSIKIGWGVKGKSHTIEHLSEPIWLAVLDETEVIAHLDGQILSKVDWENLTANYSDSTRLNQEWRVVITTKGEFDAVWYDRNVGKIIRRSPQNHTLTWFAKDNPLSNKPLFLNEK